MNNLWYFPLELIKSRYTKQLSQVWMPDAFIARMPEYGFKVLGGSSTRSDIQVGQVLDATGRSIYSFSQISRFLKALEDGSVSQDDVLYFQDFWTPGMEAIFYALQLYGIKVKVYSMLHAQTVDWYDFTYPMRKWMRGIELAYDSQHQGIFVASTVHKELLRIAGFEAPIHVVGLPIQVKDVESYMSDRVSKKNQIVYCSRLDAEKQPLFMLQVAQKFLSRHVDFTWVVTTSRNQLSSNQSGVVEILREYAANESRFEIKEGLSKEAYYQQLQMSRVQFNCSLQDFVSWTLLEACIAGCDLAYPAYRSFIECVPARCLYSAFDVDSAVESIENGLERQENHIGIARLCDQGRYYIAELIKEGGIGEFNIWGQ